MTTYTEMIKDGSCTFLLVKDGVERQKLTGKGVKPFLVAYKESRDYLRGGDVFDKVIGKAAAMLAVDAGVHSVYGEVMSKSGYDYLTAHSIDASFGTLVPMISNRTGDGMCPLEACVQGIDNAQAGIEAIQKTINRLMNGDNYVVLAGSVTYDITVTAKRPLLMGDKNPYNQFRYSAGGVSLNIARNLSKIGVDAKMLAVVGDDANGTALVQDGVDSGVDMSNVDRTKEEGTATFVAVNNEDGELVVGVADMSVTNNCSRKEYFASKKYLIEGAKLLFVGPCIMEESLEFFNTHFMEIPKFMDMEASDYARKAMKVLSSIHTLKVNEYELQELTGMNIETEEDMEKGCDWVIAKGVRRVFVTLGSKGVFYKDTNGTVRRKHARKVSDILSTNGAGDAFMAGIIYSFLHDFDLEKTLAFSMAMSASALKSLKAIHPDLSLNMVEKLMME